MTKPHVLNAPALAQDTSELSDPATGTPQPRKTRHSARQRPYTLSGRIPRRALERIRAEIAADEAETGGLPPMPKTWGECQARFGAKTPCPYVRCRHHNAVEVVAPRTAIRPPSLKLAFPHLDATEIPETCSLRAADRKGMMLDEVAINLNMTRERARQIEAAALAKLKPHMIQHAPGEYDDHFDDADELH